MEVNINNISSSYTQTAQNLSHMLDSSDELKNTIVEMCENGEQSIAIGYTKVYLKEVEIDESTKECVPMTVREVEEMRENMIKPLTIGDSSNGPYGNFTLYTAASYSGTTINATSVATFNWESSNNNCSPAPNCFDYISIAFPYDAYTITYSEMPSTVHSYSKCIDNERAVAYDVLLYKGWPGKSYHDIKCSARAVRNKALSIVKVGSSYIHNYETRYLSGVSMGNNSFTMQYTFVQQSWIVSSSVIL